MAGTHRHERFLVGVDVGTSVVKSVAFNDLGEVVAIARRGNSFDTPRPGWAECDMHAVWKLVTDALREVTAALPGGAQEVQAVGVSGNMGGSWLTDAKGIPVRPAILWNDGRAAGVLNAWREEGVIDDIFDISCNTPVPGFSVPLLAWLAENEPETLARARYLFFSKDWIRYRLTGERFSEESDASHMPGDAAARGYSERILARCGIADLQRLLLPLTGSGAVAGRVHARAAEETGLRQGTPVVAGLADVTATLTGAGAVSAGCATAIIGTSCLNSVTTSAPLYEPRNIGFSFLIPEGKWTRTLSNQTGTLALSWFRREFMVGSLARSPHDFEALERQAASVPLGARGIIFHPYLNGTGVSAPVYEPRARARFWGVGIEHTRTDMLRAIYEGVALSMADCFEHLPPFEGPVRLMGGGARSRLWRQMFADVTGRPMVLLRGEELGALGVAMLAGVATGVWRDLQEACEGCCHSDECVEPDTRSHEAYARILAMYQRLRRDLSDECDYKGELWTR